MLRDVEGQDDGEDRVWPAGLGVHVGGGHRPGLVALLHQTLYLLGISHCHGSQALHIGAKNVVFPLWKVSKTLSNRKFLPDFQPILLPSIFPIQQVKHFLIIDFHVADLNIGLKW